MPSVQNSSAIQNKKDKEPDSAGEPCPDNRAEGSASHVAQNAKASGDDLPEERPVEHGGQPGLEPTRYGDWEKKGRCTDF